MTMVKREQTIKYKKAPLAPRRFKSAYMFFSTDKHREIRKELGEKLQTTEVAKMVSRAWKDLSREERGQWDERARRDKARYEVEKTMYTGPWKIPAKQRTQKDPAAPKRPMSAFLSFGNSRRAMVKAQNPNIGNTEVSRILAKMWKAAPEQERKEHIDREFELRKKYKCAIAKWRKIADQKLDDLRKKREDMAMRTVDARTSGKTTPGPEGASVEDSPASWIKPSVGCGELPHHQYHYQHYQPYDQHYQDQENGDVKSEKCLSANAAHPITLTDTTAAAAARGIHFPRKYPTQYPTTTDAATVPAPVYSQHYGSYGYASARAPAGSYYETTSSDTKQGNPLYSHVTPPFGSQQDHYGIPTAYSQGCAPSRPPDAYEAGYDLAYYGSYYHHAHQEAMPLPWRTSGPGPGPGGYYGAATRSQMGPTATGATAGRRPHQTIFLSEATMKKLLDP